MYEHELAFVKKTIKKTYMDLISEPLVIMDKGDFDTVTNIDYAVEEALIAAIKHAFPFDNVISEEFNPTAQVNGRTWIIDPIDGTVNFSRNSNVFGIQLAFFDHDEVVLSYLYFPRTSEEYYALRGGGAFYQDKPLKAPSRPVKQMIMSFSDFFVFDEKANRFVEQVFLGVKDQIFRTRLQGSAAYDFALVARGINDALLLRTTNLWDLAPGYLLMQECGCIVVNEKMEPYSFGDYALFAFNNAALIPLLKAILNK